MKNTMKNTIKKEYRGKFEGKPLDTGKRVKFPVNWLSIDETFILVSVEEDPTEPKRWNLYPSSKWAELMDKKKIEKDKISFASRSSKEITLDKNARLLIPMGTKGQKITLIGVIDYIIIEEFTSKESAE